MAKRLFQLFQQMTAPEQEELEAFAAFIIARRKLQDIHVINDDISVGDMIQLVVDSGSFDWLDSKGEDLYSIEDGEEVQWPVKQ